MNDLSKYNLKSLFSQLEGRQLEHFFNDYAFKDPADYAAQAPSIFPLGTLHLIGADGGRGSGQRWATEDEAIFVDTDSDGEITWVHEAR